MKNEKLVWAVIGAEGLKGTFAKMVEGMEATKAANGGAEYKRTLNEKGLKNILFPASERSYVIKRMTEAEAVTYIKTEQNGKADFSYEHTLNDWTIIETGTEAGAEVETAAVEATTAAAVEAAAQIESDAEDERGERPEHGFMVNASAVLNTFVVSEYEDEEIVKKQLWEAPLFSSISVDDIYMKRADIMYNLTNGAEVLEAVAADMSDYLSRFKRQLTIALNEMYCRMTYNDYQSIERFWRNDSIIRRGLTENKIDSVTMENYSIRSPKFSKHLIKTFGEKSEVVKLFNDRPKPEALEKETVTIIEDQKLIISNLAANVMKMTANNKFSSCQDYTYEEENDLDYLQKLPSSVNDETLSIAYIVDEDESYENPHMLARVLISPHEYNGQLFFIGWNGYGDFDILKSSLKNLYGDRFLFADELYNTDDMHSWEHKYNYRLRVDFEYNNTCYMCEGSGEVEVTVRWHDYTFTTECPECNGSGNIGEGCYGAYPYVNNGHMVKFYNNTKLTYADRKLMDSILEEERYGGADLFSAMSDADLFAAAQAV